MVYSASHHNVFSQRMRNFVLGYQAALEEIERIDQIYINETSSGNHVEFKNTSIATKNEHTNLITFMREFRGFTDGTTNEVQKDRRATLAAFTG